MSITHDISDQHFTEHSTDQFSTVLQCNCVSHLSWIQSTSSSSMPQKKIDQGAVLICHVLLWNVLLQHITFVSNSSFLASPMRCFDHLIMYPDVLWAKRVSPWCHKQMHIQLSHQLDFNVLCTCIKEQARCLAILLNTAPKQTIIPQTETFACIPSRSVSTDSSQESHNAAMG